MRGGERDDARGSALQPRATRRVRRRSWYKALTLQLTKRMTHGTQFNLNYTFAKGTDTAPLGGATLAVQGDAARSDPQDLLRDKGPNQLDTVTRSTAASSRCRQ